jgi:phosphoribosylformimino-5-aminoimidazole carboxamide ribonucleotide (ProFAR) isomerase
MEKLHLVPVIHLVDGNALIENKKTGEKMFTDPVDLAVELDELGFDELLLIDDIGEEKGHFSAYDLAYEIADYTSFEITAKGGLRSFDSIAKIFETGIARAMLTSLAISDPEMVGQLIDAYGSNSFIIGMDFLNDSLVFHNKKEVSDKPIEHIIESYSSMGIDRFTLQSYNELFRKNSPDPLLFEKIMAIYPRIRLYAGEGIDNTEQFLTFENSYVKGMFLGDEFYTDADLFKGMRKYLAE